MILIVSFIYLLIIFFYIFSIYLFLFYFLLLSLNFVIHIIYHFLLLSVPGGTIEQFGKLLGHRQGVLRVRTCILIRLLGRFCCRALQQVWGKPLRNLIENLLLDEEENVRNVSKIDIISFFYIYIHVRDLFVLVCRRRGRRT